MHAKRFAPVVFANLSCNGGDGRRQMETGRKSDDHQKSSDGPNRINEYKRNQDQSNAPSGDIQGAAVIDFGRYQTRAQWGQQ